ncbi:g-type lectin s-receptor-like serine/threonine-protein kinase b120 [Phtheirospermum japonicum]|uniref:non-specific serine/threonine protein kinase n=1 Tax=Phtheirospermum japonicum TaxID=374723 RepID=A0A830BK99_9LAMI|nr:g-type lectin s-receptor-like serine/threonine-protein kinase b120 [Phtheirospermum japonicum]
MGEKNKKTNEGEQKEEGENKKKNNVTVVLKADLHCEGCASKVIKCIRSFDGVDTVTTGDGQKITVVGKVDPAKLREKVEQKTNKKVELISPQPKNDRGGGDNKENDKGKENGGGDSDNGKQEKKKESKEKYSNDKSDQKNPKEKEIPVTTAEFKVNLHCDGCIQKIYKTVTKTIGYEDMKIDKQKDLVSVTGAIDMKALAEVLSKQLKKDLEIVSPKKDGEKKENSGSGEKGKNGADEKAEGNKMQASLGGYPYPFVPGPVVIGDQFHYNPYPVYQYQAPQIFSDENPNACSVISGLYAWDQNPKIRCLEWPRGVGPEPPPPPLPEAAALQLTAPVLRQTVSNLATAVLLHRRKDDLELPTYDLSIVTKATNSFSDNNKLGEGGFGPVYKGMLDDGKEIAVKRLSKTSMQGLDEFRNEVSCIAKLQHRNLVKLLGCCIQGDEKMLIYEYMPNNSLDFILLVLEIVSGQRSGDFHHTDHHHDLLGHERFWSATSFSLVKEKKISSLSLAALSSSSSRDEKARKTRKVPVVAGV